MTENKSWCPLPWSSVNIRNNGDYRVCCHANTSKTRGILKDGDSVSYNASKDDIESVRNSPMLKDLRKMMLNNERSEICVRCNREDDAGVNSRRAYERRDRAHAITIEMAEQMTNNDGSINTKDFPVDYVDVRFGNLCNLKCRMCSPTDSNVFYKEHFETEGPKFYDTTGWVNLKKVGNKVAVDGYDPYSWFQNQQFWQDIENYIGEITEIHMAGGEPFLIDEHYTFLEKFITAGTSKNVKLIYNSNIVTIPERAWKIWENFKLVKLGISIDGYDKVNEYIRFPSKWSTITKNINLIEESNANIVAWIATTVQAYNIYYLPELLKWRIENDFKRINAGDQYPFVSPHPLHTPRYFNIKVFPKSVKMAIEDRLNDFYFGWFKDYLPNFRKEKQDIYDRQMRKLLDSYISMMNAEDWSEHLYLFFKETERMDKYRGQSFADALPELYELLAPFK